MNLKPKKKSIKYLTLKWLNGYLPIEGGGPARYAGLARHALKCFDDLTEVSKIIRNEALDPQERLDMVARVLKVNIHRMDR